MTAGEISVRLAAIHGAGLERDEGAVGALVSLATGAEPPVRLKAAEALVGAASLEDRVGRLAAVRTREGYMAEWRRLDDASFLLAENHCPICAAAATCQGLCREELSLFSAVLGDKARVERTDHILAGARRCAYRITTADTSTARRY